jgi:hypothetical protein
MNGSTYTYVVKCNYPLSVMQHIEKVLPMLSAEWLAVICEMLLYLALYDDTQRMFARELISRIYH